MSRLAYQLFRRKEISQHSYPENTTTSITIKGGSSGVGYNTKYEPQFESVISREEFSKALEEVDWV
jgi:hypothetical protein